LGISEPALYTECTADLFICSNGVKELLCTHTHGLHQFVLPLIHGRKNQTLLNKRGWEVWACRTVFLVPPSSLAKTHKNGLLAVYVDACLEMHLVECFGRLSPSSTLTHCTLCLLLQLCRVFALATYSTCSSFNFFFFFFGALCNLL